MEMQDIKKPNLSALSQLFDSLLKAVRSKKPEGIIIIAE